MPERLTDERLAELEHLCVGLRPGREVMDVAEQAQGRCVVLVDGTLEPCADLEPMIEGNYMDHRGKKGLFSLTIFDDDNGLYPFRTKRGVVLCCGAHSKRGVILRYCPFCGASISHHLRPKNEAEEVAPHT